MKLKLNIQRFSATNHTAHYDLSQYTANDKPTYLVDYNGDMAKIDAGIYEANQRSLVNESAIGTLSNLGTTAKSDLVSAINEVNTQVGANTTNIGTNTANIATLGGNIGDLINLTTVAKNNLVSAINEVKGVNDTQNTNIGDLSQLETITKADLVNAINELKANLDNFNLTNFRQLENSDITITNGSLNNQNLNIATNSDLSLAKIYGNISIKTSGSSVAPIVSFQTDLRPSSEINIQGILMYWTNTSRVANTTLKIKTDGTVQFTLWIIHSSGQSDYSVNISPCLLWIKDFGDTPYNPNI